VRDIEDLKVMDAVNEVQQVERAEEGGKFWREELRAIA
jgi:hypothetical protein